MNTFITTNTKKSIMSLLVLGLAMPAFAAEYDIDLGHSSVNFKIRHLVSKTTGKFEKFNGTLAYEAGNPSAWKVEAEIDTASINTSDAKRDKHLRSKDFFDVQKYPKMTFKSTKVTDANDKTAKVEGMLSLHGVTKPVVLDVEIGGEGVDPWGNKKAGFTAKTKINRKDYGIVYNSTLESGGLLLGEDVEITLEIEANARKVALAGAEATAEATAKKSKKETKK